MAQQTAVEWLNECLLSHFNYEQRMQFEGLFQQAKAMEKEQIKDAYYGGSDFTCKEELSERYYNETFNH
jgi:hypothetical protein